MPVIDQWLSQYEEVQVLANDISSIIQERNVKFPTGGPEASRLTATARRRLGELQSRLDQLQQDLGSAQLSDRETRRRQDLISSLRTRREVMGQALRRDSTQDRQDLLAGGSQQRAQETAATADKDTQGLIQLQEQRLKEQERVFDELDRTVGSIKHIGLAMNEELSLQQRLLGELDEEVEVVGSRMGAAKKALAAVYHKSKDCKYSISIIAMVVALIVTVVLVIFFI